MTAETSSSRPVPKKGIMDIAAYVPGSHSVAGVKKVHKLSSNESPLGPSRMAIEAFRQSAGHLETYPDGESTGLRQAISEVTGLAFERLMIGNGSDEILGLLANTYLAPGDEGIMTEHGFSVYEIQMRGAGAKPIIVKEENCRVSVDNVLKAVNNKTRIVFITNPGNPTGTYLPSSEIRRLHAGLPKTVLLVLDSAYAEYVDKDDYEVGLELVSDADNVVVTRTFSKVHGLAALRVGWMYAPAHVIDAVNRLRGPFNVNSGAQAAAAASIRDRGFIAQAVAYNATWRAWLTTELSALGLRVTPSVTNFLLIHFQDDAKKSAALADAALKANGYILRRVTGYGFPNALRLSIGSEEANRGVVATLKEFLK